MKSALRIVDVEGGMVRIDSRTGAAIEIFKALASEPRVAILRYLGDRLVSVNQIAQDLDLPPSTANRHIAMLEEAGLLRTHMRPASRGLQKVCARNYDAILVDLPRAPRHVEEATEMSMPVGAYSDFSVEPTCGLASATGLIGLVDDPDSFYDPEHIEAQLIWFRSGYLEYRFPNRVPPGARVDSLELAVEICSEAPLHDLDWPSDISVWINGVHLGEWTCPSDFGGQRGRITPAWWPTAHTQFGVQKRWRVGPGGTSIDGVGLSSVTISQLGLAQRGPIVVRIGVRPEARRVGGLNVFGRGFGNYPQDIVLHLEHAALDES